MFLALDECKEGKNVLGLLAIPLTQVSDLERDFCALRIETKTWGELGWSRLSKSYLKKYIAFIDLFLKNPEATFHAITYSKGRKFHAAHSLIRVVSRKMWKAGMYSDRELYILFDQDTEAFNKPQPIVLDGTITEQEPEFRNAYEAIQAIARRSGIPNRFRHHVSFCHQGASHQLGTLQLTDLLTGVVNAVINKRTDLREEQTALIEHIHQSIGHDFEASRAELQIPSLLTYKIHFLDPIQRAVELKEKVSSTGVESVPF